MIYRVKNRESILEVMCRKLKKFNLSIRQVEYLLCPMKQKMKRDGALLSWGMTSELVMSPKHDWIWRVIYKGKSYCVAW